MTTPDGWLSLPCPCPANDRNGECEGEVKVWMDGGSGDWNHLRHANGDVVFCDVCGYGSTTREVDVLVTIANGEEEACRHA